MKALLLSPHTDDIELAAGGTVLKFLQRGWDVYWIVFSLCRDSIPADMPSDILKTEFQSVIALLNDIRQQKYANDNEVRYQLFDYPVRRFQKSAQEILEDLVKIRNDFKPDLVMGPATNDQHQDHEVISKAMVRCFKNSCSILGTEQVWNNLDSRASYFSCLGNDHLELKWQVLQCYQSQIQLERPYFKEDVIQSMARVNGLKSGCQYAEGFECIRWID